MSFSFTRKTYHISLRIYLFLCVVLGILHSLMNATITAGTVELTGAAGKAVAEFVLPLIYLKY